MKNKIILIISVLVAFLIGGIVGYNVGASQGINWCVDVGYNLLQIKGVDIGIDETFAKYVVGVYNNEVRAFLVSGGNGSSIYSPKEWEKCTFIK